VGTTQIVSRDLIIGYFFSVTKTEGFLIFECASESSKIPKHLEVSFFAKEKRFNNNMIVLKF